MAAHTQQQNPIETISTTSHDSFKRFDKDLGHD
jgi:hypothetical protein